MLRIVLMIVVLLVLIRWQTGMWPTDHGAIVWR